ncbi:MAG: 50S ribosomal protein L1 [Acidimicrobiia bacterium]
MAKQGKIYKDAVKTIDRTTQYAPVEAMSMVKGAAKRKFNEGVDVVFRLGIDPRKADQMIRGTVALPHGRGSAVRIAVFAQGDAAREAQEAGADVVGAEDLVDRVAKGFMDFDIAIATPDLMGQVGKLGRALGPRGLMPNPKTGTVTTDVGKAVAEFKAGRVEYRADKFGNVHVPIGKASFDAQQLAENYRAVLDEVMRAKPSASKGRYVRTISVSSTMGPGVKIDPNKGLDEQA